MIKRDSGTSTTATQVITQSCQKNLSLVFFMLKDLTLVFCKRWSMSCFNTRHDDVSISYSNIRQINKPWNFNSNQSTIYEH